MPVAKQEVVIVKVPNPNKKLPSLKSFPALPKLYNELLENKVKIFPNLHDVEFTPKEKQQTNIVSPSENNSSNNSQNYKLTKENLTNSKEKNSILDKIRSLKDDDSISVDSLNTVKNNDNTDTQSVASIVSGISVEENSHESGNNVDKPPSENGFRDKLHEYFSSSNDQKTPSLTPNKYTIPKPQTPSFPSQFMPKTEQNVQNINSPSTVIPPSLNQIRSGVPENYVDLNNSVNLNNEIGTFKDKQEEEDEKRKIAHRIDLLREAYPKYSANIPEYNIYTDLKTMKQILDDGKRRAKIEHSIDRWRRYLGMSFSGVEFILGNFFKLDMQGFARHQVSNMSNYDHLLVEISEKNYVPKGSNFPVELQLLFAIVVQAGSFVVWKKISGSSGLDPSIFNPGKSTNSSSNSNSGRNNVRMKDPDISVDDI